MQIVTLIMAPVFFSAYNYILLGQAISVLGPVHSVLRPDWYVAIFLMADLISLVLQAVGGGQAARSAKNSTPTDTATDIMVAGIIFQLISMGIFVILGVDFVTRKIRGRPYAFRKNQIVADELKAQLKREKAGGEKVLVHRDSGSSDATLSGPISRTDVEKQGKFSNVVPPNLKNWWILLGASLISSLAIVTRGIFRSIELSAGWESELIQTEVLQAVLDGLMMVVAVAVFNFANPAHLLPRRASWKGWH